MQNLLLDCKRIFVTFKISLLTLVMLVGAESIGIVVELGFTALQHILFICSGASSPNHTVSSSVNKSITPSRRNIYFSNVIFL